MTESDTGTPKRLLLLSNSTMPGEPYLGWPMAHVADFLGPSASPAVFIPFAGVTISWDEYASRVRKRFTEIGVDLHSVHEAEDAETLVAAARSIVVGGGNTWALLKTLYDTGLLGLLREKVAGGTPYVGWSAGSNMACPTIRTTNDMPVVEPPSTAALGLVPFQINPHFTAGRPPGHRGETREERLAEFIERNPDTTVVGLPEGDLIRVEGSSAVLVGSDPARIFHKNEPVKTVEPGNSLAFLLD